MRHDTTITRRSFTHLGLLAGAAASLPRVAPAMQGLGRVRVDGPGMPFVMFSKHLADLAWGDLGKAVREAGFDGVDLTVRPAGHVLPERVTDDLPRAVGAIRDNGSMVAMLTTGLTRPADAAARATFAAARAVDVRLLKAGYYRYAFKDVRRELDAVIADFRGLVGLAADAGVLLAYHNHSGYVGAPVWDILEMIAGLPADATGVYFDVRHATVEGGDAGWRVATQMAAPHLRMLAAKDFYWDKGRDGRWRIVDCPIGEGMVNWPVFAAELRRAGFSGPVSLHIEYDPGGRTPVEQRERMLEAAVRDRTRLAAVLREGAAGAGRAPAPAEA
jgi:L-ribulose-5-phosphate 3-epimerase